VAVTLHLLLRLSVFISGSSYSALVSPLFLSCGIDLHLALDLGVFLLPRLFYGPSLTESVLWQTGFVPKSRR
jgi:hypothetical protein